MRALLKILAVADEVDEFLYGDKPRRSGRTSSSRAATCLRHLESWSRGSRAPAVRAGKTTIPNVKPTIRRSCSRPSRCDTRS